MAGGCATFGHSCYGGMGKRASELIENPEEIFQDVQGEENPAFVFTGPRSEYKPERPPKLTPQQYDNISRVIRQWVSNSARYIVLLTTKFLTFSDTILQKSSRNARR